MTFARGAVSGIDQRARYLDTLADIERTSLDYYATIRSLYRQRRAAMIRHERQNLPPPAGFTQNGGPSPSSVVVNQAAPQAVVYAGPDGSEVSR